MSNTKHPTQVESIDEDTLFRLKANAELVVEQIRQIVDFDFNYTLASLEWIDGYINRLRDNGSFLDENNRAKLLPVFAGYFGEVLIQNLGGEWKFVDGNLAVLLSEGGHCLPV